MDAWTVTNQTLGRPDQIDFGSEMFGFWLESYPIAVDNIAVMNRFKGGYIFDIGTRKSRWDSIAKELERLKGKDENSMVL